ncbi:Outer membrane adhesin like protein [Sphingomonas paucimobilis]|nr:Outer membrane adhesin like protein [Sphingomonas paucimobilis]
MSLLDKMIGEEVFLQGNYLSVAINSSGSIGSRSTAPAGFVTDVDNGFVRLGIMADMDGFNKGVLGTTRDAMLQGSSIEGFTVGYDIGSKHYVKANSERNSIVQIAGGDGSDQSSASSGKAGWTGTTSENVKVSQVVTMGADDKYMKFEVTLTNQSATTLTDLRYLRSIDPDHGVDFKTINTIVEQGGDGGNGALVAAYMMNGTTPLFYYTQDDRARVSTYGLDNRDPYASAAYANAPAEGTSVKADQAININFGLGKLDAGASTTITFYLGITDDLAGTVKKIDAAAAPSTPVKQPPAVTAPPPPANNAPVAAADSLTVKSGSTGTGNVLANDKDVDGDALTAKLLTASSNGTVTLAADGSYSYTPKVGFTGADKFTYTVSDGKASSTSTVSVTVTPPPNTAPMVTNDKLTLTAAAAGIGNVLANDKDADGDALVAKLASGPANGTLSLAANGSYVYTAKAGFTGIDSFTYTASDGKAASLGTVELTVLAPPNNAPTAIADSKLTTGTDEVSGCVLDNDYDADGDELTVGLKTGPANGTLTLGKDGSYTYVAKEGFSGVDSFTYSLSDGKETAEAVVTMVVEATPAQPPVIVMPQPPASEAPELPASTLPDSKATLPVLGWANVQAGSATANEVLTSTAQKDVFFFDIDAKSGADAILDFGKNDLLATNKALSDSNGDGLITWSKRLTLDGTDTVTLSGVKSLRLMGTDVDGAYIYANGGVRPKKALEGTMSDDILNGDVKDKKSQSFFFDSGLGLESGSDQVHNFGVKDRIITTTKLDADTSGHIDLGSTGRFALTSEGDVLGHVTLTDLSGAAVHTLEFDGAVTLNDTTYYVYSHDGSSVGVAGLNV